MKNELVTLLCHPKGRVQSARTQTNSGPIRKKAPSAEHTLKQNNQGAKGRPLLQQEGQLSLGYTQTEKLVDMEII